MKYLASLVFLTSFLFASTQQLIIDAKEFRADEKKGISSFSGNVKIKMGQDKLNAQKVDIFFITSKKTKKKIPSKYVASGDVNFTIITKSKHYEGRGNKVIYSPLKEEYTVVGNGFLEEKKDKRKLYGEKIYVNQLSGQARISGSDKKPVRFIINIQRGEK